jgi:flagellar secretion chaperone FliS
MANRVSVYLEQEILSANSLHLIHILYQSAITELRDARRNLAAREIASKCANISKACRLIGELLSVLDLNAGGELADNLKALYEYMLSRLLQANLRNLDEPMAEVIALLSTLDEGWKQLANQRQSSEPEMRHAAHPSQFGSRDVEVPAQSWSF